MWIKFSQIERTGYRKRVSCHSATESLNTSVTISVIGCEKIEPRMFSVTCMYLATGFMYLVTHKTSQRLPMMDYNG